MPLYLGGQRIAKLYRGAVPIARAYKGAALVFDMAEAGGYTDPVTAKSYSLNSNNNGNGTVSIRTVVSNLAAGGTQIRVRFVASTTNPITVANAAVGIRSGSTVSTAAAPVELLFGGASGFALAAGQQITSDWADFVTTASDNLLVIFDCVTNGSWRSLNPGGDGFYYRLNYASYNQASPGSFTFVSGRTECVGLVDVRSAL